MLSGSELRKGVVIVLNDKLYQVIDYKHIKMKRTALAHVKLRDIVGGHTIEQSFQSDDKFVRAHLDTRNMQYLYNDEGLYYFMDTENFEQITVNESQVSDSIAYLKEGMQVEVSSYKEKILDIELPVAVELEVVETEPGFKGDTATAGNKPAKLETGTSIQVPLFINIGDIVKVDTRSGAYLERKNG
ncbi:MAG: elongation factor P [Dehalococcoidales bacterium]|jgi:elongation factor P|nr:elongation factor P [Dehalococcoidales bacterium]NLT27649.1 elongation factor P [Dehalococcoidales bacterium]